MGTWVIWAVPWAGEGTPRALRQCGQVTAKRVAAELEKNKDAWDVERFFAAPYGTPAPEQKQRPT